MPVTFEDRERGFEAKFIYDKEFRFRVLARRDKAFAAWLSSTCAMTEPDAKAFQDAVLSVPDGSDHDEQVIGLGYARLAAQPGLATDHATLKAKLAALGADAMQRPDVEPQ
jgi:hypothetical protein